MASFDYGPGDIAPSVSNALVLGFISVATFASLIVLVMLYSWVRKNLK